MINMKKIGMVLEGGAFRGLYTAGVLDIFMENNINIDGIIGVSAGALFGVNYFSEQKERVIKYNKKYAKDPRYKGILSLIFTGNYINKRFAYYKTSTKYYPFDNETFIKNNKHFEAVVTNIETGKPEYIKITDPIKQMEALRATSAMPFITKIVKINNKKYLDGAIADSIPITQDFLNEYDKIVIILTRPINYKKEPLKEKDIKRLHKKYKKYPNFIKAMENRYKKYNETLDRIKELEKENKVFVIRPSKDLDINIKDVNKQNFQKIYDIGISDAKSIIKELQDYLK